MINNILQENINAIFGRLSEGASGIGFIKLENNDTGKGLDYKNYEYVIKYRNTFQKAVELNKDIDIQCTSNKDVNNKNNSFSVNLTVDDMKDINEEDNSAFADHLILVIKDKNPDAKCIQKDKGLFFSNDEGGQDIKLSTNFQEAIQGYIIQKFWNSSSLSSDKEFIDLLCSEDFEQSIRWDLTGGYDFEKFKANLSNCLTKKGYAKSKTWLQYFIVLAKQVGTKIKQLYSGALGSQALLMLSKQPKVYARGLITDYTDEVDHFFADAILGKAKDTVNKADILLDFNNKAGEYFDECLRASTIEEYSAICDKYLSSGECIGLSLKKGTDDLHVELLASTTSINKDVFGDNAAKAIYYCGEENPNNTFVSIKQTVNDKESLEHINIDNGNMVFEPYTVKDKNGVTSAVNLKLNKDADMISSFGNHIHIAIRQNGGEGRVTVEAKAGKSEAQAQLGKLVTPLEDASGIMPPEKANSIEKINAFLEMLNVIAEKDDADLRIATIISSTGYPLARKDNEKTTLLMAPVIKLS